MVTPVIKHLESDEKGEIITIAPQDLLHLGKAVCVESHTTQTPQHVLIMMELFK